METEECNVRYGLLLKKYQKLLVENAEQKRIIDTQDFTIETFIRKKQPHG